LRSGAPSAGAFRRNSAAGGAERGEKAPFKKTPRRGAFLTILFIIHHSLFIIHYSSFIIH
ncbi:MAG: hypothetical protein IJX54_02680, partial [Oscillospiraceae bacterium]|nr:hypothetical protein [Oscillospiraceae bacterium]